MTLKVVEGMGYKSLTINTKDDLIELIFEELNKPEERKLIDICDSLGLYDTITIFDKRTLQLWSLFQTYKYAPHLINNMVFHEAVEIFNQYEYRGLL